MNALVISSRQDYWRALVPEFASGSIPLDCTSTVDDALDKLGEAPPLLVILDAQSPGGGETEADYIRRVRKELAAILKVNAAVHTAVVSGLDDDAFHDAMEGYGVLLRIPPMPGGPDVARLSAALEQCRAF